MADAQATDATVTLRGFQTYRVVGLLEDRVLEVMDDLASAVEAGLSEDREAITTAIERLSDLKGSLELLE